MILRKVPRDPETKRIIGAKWISLNLHVHNASLGSGSNIPNPHPFTVDLSISFVLLHGQLINHRGIENYPVAYDEAESPGRQCEATGKANCPATRARSSRLISNWSQGGLHPKFGSVLGSDGQ